MDIELWRIRQLALVLEQIARLLKSGANAEWAGVFSHYLNEIERQFLQNPINIHALKQLVVNIKNCYMDVDSFVDLELVHSEDSVADSLNREFNKERALLYKIILDMESRMKEYSH